MKARIADPTALKLSEQGFFWVGHEPEKVPYGTIIAGQMYVQYLTPAKVRHPYPVVLVHGGTGQMLHYMGPGGRGLGALLRAGRLQVYLIDRPGHGRAPYHPDALGPIGAKPPTRGLSRGLAAPRSAGDSVIDQFMASQNAAPQDSALRP